MLGGSGGNGDSTQYNKYYLQFRRGAKDAKPYFTVRYDSADNGDVTRVSGILKGVFHNPEMDKTKKDGTPYTAQENYVVRLVDGEDQYNIQVDVQSGQQLRGMLNSLLSAKIGDKVELATYETNPKGEDKKRYKVISVTNPDIKVEKTFKDAKGEDKTASLNEAYSWAIEHKELPKVEVTKNKKGEIVDVDDSAVSKVFFDAIKEKFSKEATQEDNQEETEISIEDTPF